MVLSITLSHTHPHTPHTHTHTTYTHPHTIHAVLNTTYQSSVLPKSPVDVSAMRTHGASVVSMPTQPQRGQEEGTSHTLVAAEVLHGRRMKDTVTDTSYVILCSPLQSPHSTPPPSPLPTPHISRTTALSFFPPPLPSH